MRLHLGPFNHGKKNNGMSKWYAECEVFGREKNTTVIVEHCNNIYVASVNIKWKRRDDFENSLEKLPQKCETKREREAFVSCYNIYTIRMKAIWWHAMELWLWLWLHEPIKWSHRNDIRSQCAANGRSQWYAEDASPYAIRIIDIYSKIVINSFFSCAPESSPIWIRLRFTAISQIQFAVCTLHIVD